MLNQIKFEPVYISNENPGPIDFFQSALNESTTLDLGLGYFSTAAFNVLCSGFARFISNGGKMRMYMNQDLTKEDYNMLSRGEVPDFDERLVNSFEEMRKTFSIYNEHFFSCLSYLISVNRLEINIIVPISEGIAHEKYGIFKDNKGNKVSFIGSLNFTRSAFLKNQESIDCSCSWKGEDSIEKIESYEKRWQKVWNRQDPNVRVFDAPLFCREIMKEYPKKELNEIVKAEESLIKQFKIQQLMEQEEDYLNRSAHCGPHFPDSYPNGPLTYQKEAYNSWKEHNSQGIFAMATGTGKTVTSLNCALEEYKNDRFYHLIIAVPSKALTEQWEKEVKKFGFGDNIILVGSINPTWRKDIGNLRLHLSINDKTNFVIIVTYDSLISKVFQQALPFLSKDAILIADEVHNVGAATKLPVFENMTINRRIGLSATPNRVYDEDGSQRIAHIFNELEPPYTYEFTMEQAIFGPIRRLCHYNYYPRIAYLNDEEMEKYVKITRQINMLNVNDESPDELKQKRDSLLIKRKRILHKCEQKTQVFLDILDEIGEDNLQYAFVYCPEGNKQEGELSSDEAKRLIENIIAEAKQQYPKKNFSVYLGETSSEQRRALIEAFTDGDVNAIFAMKCLDEGVDVPRAEIGIFLSSTGNPRQFIQRRGRLLRIHPDKEKAKIYDIIVSPDFNSRYYDRSLFDLERSLVEKELIRVAHFAKLADNYHSLGNDGIYNSLKKITDHYILSIAKLISEI